MLPLNKVLPITLKLDGNGKKVPLYGLDKSKRINHTEGMEDFAIYMADYPEIIVLDLDTKEHKYKHYIDKSYSHETRKGWHIFFKNTYAMKNKVQRQKEHYDVLCGNNWIFYNYNDPEVAYYKEHNQLPLAEMPKELYESVKIKANDAMTPGTESTYEMGELVSMIYSKFHKNNKWTIDNSSELAHAIVSSLVPYTQNLTAIASVLNNIEEIDSKHSEPSYLERHITNIRTQMDNRKVNWRSLDEYRLVLYGDATRYANIPQRTLVGKEAVDLMLIKDTKIDYLKHYTKVYEYADFLPRTDNKKFVGNTYNLFDGWIDAVPGQGHEQYLNFLRDVICDGNMEHYTYLIGYMAHMVQQPEQRPDVSIVLYGPEKGTGKDTVHVLLGQVLQPSAYNVFAHEELFGQFNERLGETLLGVASELVFGGSHKEDSRLKSLITDNYHTVRAMKQKHAKVHNYIRLFVTSNSRQPVRATSGERRYFALQPNTSRKGEDEYWSALYRDFNPSNLLFYLRHYDLGQFIVTRIPYSEHLSDIVAANITQMEEMILDWWETKENNDIVDTKELFEMFGHENKFLTRRKFTALMFDTIGKHHFKPTTKKGKNVLSVIGKEVKMPDPDKVLTK